MIKNDIKCVWRFSILGGLKKPILRKCKVLFLTYYRRNEFYTLCSLTFSNSKLRNETRLAVNK